MGWRDLFTTDVAGIHHREHMERHRLLPAFTDDEPPPDHPSKEITKVALRLKYQIEQVIPCELDEDAITRPNSVIITPHVVRTAIQAGGEDLQATVPFCLLVCLRWFKRQARDELWDSGLHERRAVACEVIAKRIIEGEENQDHLLINVLLKRYSIIIDGEETVPANVVERAVDLHALRIIGSSGYQKCIKYLWYGWVCQQDGNPTNFVPYDQKDSSDFVVHFHPDRMRAPMYQNACQIFFSLVYLALYTEVINTVNPTGDVDVIEGILYVMTLGFLCDELSKLWKIGRNYFDFWNAFNFTLYSFLAVSFFLRIAALTRSNSVDNEERQALNRLSYNFLAFVGPMFWMRMMLYLDTFRFFGAMFVVLRVMMKESLIFFLLLFVVLIGFFQGFTGMAHVENVQSGTPITRNIITGMANSIMQSPDFGIFEDFAFPFGIILYYVFNFVVMIILLNILIALYNSAYEDISGNAIDEYMAVFAQKTMQFVRAPDENVFIPREAIPFADQDRASLPSDKNIEEHADRKFGLAFNLLELIFLVLPFEWWLPQRLYARLNDFVMLILYSPLLLITAYLEVRDAKKIQWNRRRGEEDDDNVQEWEHVAEQIGFEVDDVWKQTVGETTPNVLLDNCTLEVMQLREQVVLLTEMVKQLAEDKTTESFMKGGSSSTIAD